MTVQDIAGRLDARLKTVRNEIARLLQGTHAPPIAADTGNDPRRYAVVDPELSAHRNHREYTFGNNLNGWSSREFLIFDGTAPSPTATETSNEDLDIRS